MYSHSRINCFKMCPKQYQYKYIDEIYPLESDTTNLDVGKAVHHGIEHGSSDAAIDLMDNTAYFQTENGETKKILVEAMVDAYLNKFPDDRTHMEYEAYVVGNLTNDNNYQLIFNKQDSDDYGDVDYQGYVDGLEYDPKLDGYWIHEVKTASQIGDVYVKKLEFNDQVSRYWFMLSKVLTKPILGCKYRIIKKPAIRQKKTESIVQYRKRLTEKLSEENSVIEIILHRTDQDIKDCIDDTIADMNNIKNCKRCTKNLTACGIYGECPYMALCSNLKDGELLFKRKDDN